MSLVCQAVVLVVCCEVWLLVVFISNVLVTCAIDLSRVLNAPVAMRPCCRARSERGTLCNTACHATNTKLQGLANSMARSGAIRVLSIAVDCRRCTAPLQVVTHSSLR